MAGGSSSRVKKETVGTNVVPKSKKSKPNPGAATPLIELSSSDSDSGSESESDSRLQSDSSSSDDGGSVSKLKSNGKKKRKRAAEDLDSVLPVGFLDPLPAKGAPLPLPWRGDEPSSLAIPAAEGSLEPSMKQFWKAGDYEGAPSGDWDSSNGGMDRVRVHPKFLHSNATSHKWVLGAFAELLDNSLDEVRSGATYVNIDMAQNTKNGSKMLLIEDDGGGMDPDKIRHCMSLGYSAKSKLADTIGQYGNGFKTSTMRLGADVIVFSRSLGNDGKRCTQSIGLLSYTFLRNTGKEDIVVPMLDYERAGEDWIRIGRPSSTEWNQNVETIVQWSPFSSEADLLQQFNHMQDQGTRIYIYNLWEDDEGLLELDFDSDPHDIQIRGVNRDEKNIDMAQKCPNSKHFLTYRHSLRSYAAILYLRTPPNFRMILRGKDIEHHNIVNDMMMSQEVTYRPQPGVDGIPKDSNMVAVVTIGFVKDARSHVDVQGFNVYHKNRLIKPFWRVWHPPGSDGRGVIGVLEANFIEPAHDKQGFERTTILARLETRLIQMQRTYWTSNCHKIGYAPRGSKKNHQRGTGLDTPTPQPKTKKSATSDKTHNLVDKGASNGHSNGKGDARVLRKRPSYTAQPSSHTVDASDDDDLPNRSFGKQANQSSSKHSDGKNKSQDISNHEAERYETPSQRTTRVTRSSASQNVEFSPSSSSPHVLAQLKEENLQLKERLKRKEVEILGDMLQDLNQERERCKALEAEVEQLKRVNEELKLEQESLIDIFSEERQRRDIEEETMRKKLREASNTIEQLLSKIKVLDNKASRSK
ncbi:protein MICRORCHIDIA 7-like [Andrographis paniculata]|uniref:protein MICRORCHIDIA 7-like n=1 Tax=Andrographis paniculata TaxID=175694 RepID=UPI0021E83EC0|nr:protein MICRORCHIDIA 7-like [Andrographis paniculata]